MERGDKERGDTVRGDTERGDTEKCETRRRHYPLSTINYSLLTFFNIIPNHRPVL